MGQAVPKLNKVVLVAALLLAVVALVFFSVIMIPGASGGNRGTLTHS